MGVGDSGGKLSCFGRMHRIIVLLENKGLKKVVNCQQTPFNYLAKYTVDDDGLI